MNELQAQSLVVNAVRIYDGFGVKLAHKFLVGIPDLLLCLPNQPIGLWEVKIDNVPKRDNYITLKLTQLQEKTLNDLNKAGGYCGVISFLRDGQKLSIAAFRYDILRYEDSWTEKHRVSILGYAELRRGLREETIVSVLERAHGQRV
jgi:hypothetical protein